MLPLASLVLVSGLLLNLNFGGFWKISEMLARPLPSDMVPDLSPPFGSPPLVWLTLWYTGTSGTSEVRG
jgi:hypothetical protein